MDPIFESDSWYFGQIRDDWCEHFALVIWKPKENKCESRFNCIDVNKIFNHQMLLDPKIYGEIDADVVDWKGYNLSFFKQTLVGRVLTTGGKILPIKIICNDL